MRPIPAVVLTLLLAAAGLAVPAQAASTAPVVVELFTSQGCSSCPPANANLITLSQRPDVLALSFAVTYWDRLGWKDTFGKPEFTQRQITYEPALQQFGPYTPQMVVNGASTAVGNRIGEVEALIDSAPPLNGPAIAFAGRQLEIAAGTAPVNGADVWLVRYDPQVHEVPVGRGENTGRTLPHTMSSMICSNMAVGPANRSNWTCPKPPTASRPPSWSKSPMAARSCRPRRTSSRSRRTRRGWNRRSGQRCPAP